MNGYAQSTISRISTFSVSSNSLSYPNDIRYTQNHIPYYIQNQLDGNADSELYAQKINQIHNVPLPLWVMPASTNTDSTDASNRLELIPHQQQLPEHISTNKLHFPKSLPTDSCSDTK